MSAEIEHARAAYATFADGRLDALAEWFDPEIEWIEPPQLPGARAYRGRERVLGYLRSIRDLWEDFEPEPVSFEEVPNGLVVHIHIRARARGAAVEDHVLHHVTMRDGKAVQIQVEQRRTFG